MWIEWLGRWSDSSRREQDLILPSEHVCWHTIEVSKLPWFRRLWIIQEFLLASCDPMVILGNLQIEWITFLDTTRECVDMHGENSASDVSENKQMDQPYTHFMMLYYIQRRVCFRTRGEASLYEYLALSRHAIATDPRDRVYGLLGIVKPYVAEPIIPDYSKTWPQVIAEATIVMISEDGKFPYMTVDFAFPPADKPKECYHTSSWVLYFSYRLENDISAPDNFHYFGHKLDSEGIERRRKSLRLSEDFRTLYKHGLYVGTIKEIFVLSTDVILMESRQVPMNELAAGLYDFYHRVLKPKGISPSRLYEALDTRLSTYCDLEEFVSSLLGPRNEFTPEIGFYEDVIYNTAVFLTEKGDVGATWLNNTFEIRAGDIIVALFERGMPFILRPVQGDSTYRMVNMAYVSERSAEYTEFW